MCSFSFFSTNKIQNVFDINSEPVQTTSKARDLGVLVTDNLKWSSHISHIHSVASHLIYIVLRTFSTKNIWTLLKIYVTCIRPKLKYNSSVWSPYLKKDIKLIESVQKRFTRNVFIRCNLPFNSYEDRLTKLGIKSLEYRRLEFDLILMYRYKISHNLCDLNFFTILYFKLVIIICIDTILQFSHFFIMPVVTNFVNFTLIV